MAAEPNYSSCSISPNRITEGSRFLPGSSSSPNKIIYGGSSDLETAEASTKKKNTSSGVPKPPPPPTDVMAGQRLVRNSLLTVAIYLSIGVIAFTWLAGMSALEALYFCVVTLTTVGYGDLSAHSPATKLFVCTYILFGVAMVGALLAGIVEIVLNRQEEMLMNLLKDGNENETTGPDKSKSAKTTLAMGVLSFAMLLAVGVGVFMITGKLTMIDALYLTIVSSSTVGYGDFYPKDIGSRLFAVVFLPMSTFFLAKLCSDYAEMRVQAITKARQRRILLATLTTDDYIKMDADGDGHISREEFICRTLVQQGKVDEEDITAVVKRFEALDGDGNGYVELHEIEAECAANTNGFVTMGDM